MHLMNRMLIWVVFFYCSFITYCHVLKVIANLCWMNFLWMQIQMSWLKFDSNQNVILFWWHFFLLVLIFTEWNSVQILCYTVGINLSMQKLHVWFALMNAFIICSFWYVAACHRKFEINKNWSVSKYFGYFTFTKYSFYFGFCFIFITWVSEKWNGLKTTCSTIKRRKIKNKTQCFKLLL